MGNLDSHLIRDSMDRRSPHLKRHLDRFSRYAGLTIVTDRQTDHATPSVTIDRIYLVLRCVLITNSNQSGYRTVIRWRFDLLITALITYTKLILT